MRKNLLLLLLLNCNFLIAQVPLDSIGNLWIINLDFSRSMTSIYDGSFTKLDNAVVQKIKKSKVSNDIDFSIDLFIFYDIGFLPSSDLPSELPNGYDKWTDYIVKQKFNNENYIDYSDGFENSFIHNGRSKYKLLSFRNINEFADYTGSRFRLNGEVWDKKYPYWYSFVALIQPYSLYKTINNQQEIIKSNKLYSDNLFQLFKSVRFITFTDNGDENDQWAQDRNTLYKYSQKRLNECNNVLNYIMASEFNTSRSMNSGWFVKLETDESQPKMFIYEYQTKNTIEGSINKNAQLFKPHTSLGDSSISIIIPELIYFDGDSLDVELVTINSSSIKNENASIKNQYFYPHDSVVFKIQNDDEKNIVITLYGSVQAVVNDTVLGIVKKKILFRQIITCVSPYHLPLFSKTQITGIVILSIFFLIIFIILFRIYKNNSITIEIIDSNSHIFGFKNKFFKNEKLPIINLLTIVEHRTIKLGNKRKNIPNYSSDIKTTHNFSNSKLITKYGRIKNNKQLQVPEGEFIIFSKNQLLFHKIPALIKMIELTPQSIISNLPKSNEFLKQIIIQPKHYIYSFIIKKGPLTNQNILFTNPKYPDKELSIVVLGSMHVKQDYFNHFQNPLHSKIKDRQIALFEMHKGKKSFKYDGLIFLDNIDTKLVWSVIYLKHPFVFNANALYHVFEYVQTNFTAQSLELEVEQFYKTVSKIIKSKRFLFYIEESVYKSLSGFATKKNFIKPISIQKSESPISDYYTSTCPFFIVAAESSFITEEERNKNNQVDIFNPFIDGNRETISYVKEIKLEEQYLFNSLLPSLPTNGKSTYSLLIQDSVFVRTAKGTSMLRLIFNNSTKGLNLQYLNKTQKISNNVNNLLYSHKDS